MIDTKSSDYLSKNFRVSEFRCPCGKCSNKEPHPSLIHVLQRCREEIGEPIVITSGWRCRDWNRSVGGVDRSLHLEGLAVDIKMQNDRYSYYLIKALQRHDDVRHIIIYPKHIHVSIWGTYRVGDRALWVES